MQTEFNLDDLEALSRKNDDHYWEKIRFLAYCGALYDVAPKLIKHIRVLELMVDMMAEDMSNTLGKGECRKECLLSQYEHKAKWDIDRYVYRK